MRELVVEEPTSLPVLGKVLEWRKSETPLSVRKYIKMLVTNEAGAIVDTIVEMPWVKLEVTVTSSDLKFTCQDSECDLHYGKSEITPIGWRRLLDLHKDLCTTLKSKVDAAFARGSGRLPMQSIVYVPQNDLAQQQQLPGTDSSHSSPPSFMDSIVEHEDSGQVNDSVVVDDVEEEDDDDDYEDIDDILLPLDEMDDSSVLDDFEQATLQQEGSRQQLGVALPPLDRSSISINMVSSSDSSHLVSLSRHAAEPHPLSLSTEKQSFKLRNGHPHKALVDKLMRMYTKCISLKPKSKWMPMSQKKIEMKLKKKKKNLDLAHFRQYYMLWKRMMLGNISRTEAEIQWKGYCVIHGVTSMPETFKPLTQQVGTSGIDSLVTCGCRATYRLADLLAENKHNCARQLSPRKICNAPLLKSVQGVMVPRLRGGCLTALAVAERVVLFDELVLELRRNPQPACTRCGHVYSVYEGDGVSEMVLNDMGEYDLLDVKAAWFSDGSSSNKRSKIFSDILTILTSRAQFVMNEELRIRFSIVLNGPTVDAGDTHIQALAPLFKELAEGVECRFFDGRKCVFRLEVVSICGDRPALSTIFGVKSHKSTFYKCLACTGGSHNGQSARTMSLKASLTGNCAEKHAECVTPLGKPIYIPKTDIQYDETLPATGFNLMKCSAKHLSYFDSHATNDSSAICVNHPGVQKHVKNITFGSMVHDPLHVIYIGLGGQCFDMAWNGLKFTRIKEALVNEFDNIHTQTASSSEMKKSVKDQLSNATGILKKHIMAGSLLVATSAVLPDITKCRESQVDSLKVLTVCSAIFILVCVHPVHLSNVDLAVELAGHLLKLLPKSDEENSIQHQFLHFLVQTLPFIPTASASNCHHESEFAKDKHYNYAGRNVAYELMVILERTHAIRLIELYFRCNHGFDLDVLGADRRKAESKVEKVNGVVLPASEPTGEQPNFVYYKDPASGKFCVGNAKKSDPASAHLIIQKYAFCEQLHPAQQLFLTIIGREYDFQTQAPILPTFVKATRRVVRIPKTAIYCPGGVHRGAKLVVFPEPIRPHARPDHHTCDHLPSQQSTSN